MMFTCKNTIKILMISVILLSSIFFCNVAHANVFTDSFFGLYSFINKHVVVQIKNDYCYNYILLYSSGEWKEGELRTSLGKRYCTSYQAPGVSSEKITKVVTQSLGEGVSVSQTNILSTSSVNNPTSDVYVPGFVDGTDLNINHIVYYTNLERKNNDSILVNLKENDILKNIALIRVRDMFTNQYFEHNSPTGDNASKEADKNNYSYITIGENIALGNFDGARGIVTAWMNSPGHKANILNKNYTEIGVYAEQGLYNNQKVWISAQVFGKPLSSCTGPDVSLKDKINTYKVSADSIFTNIKNVDVELKTLDTDNTQTYNLKISERNTLAGLYNNLAVEIKKLVVEYNKEVELFNSCLKTI